MSLSNEFKKRISNISNREVLQEELQAMYIILHSEYCNSISIEMKGKITYVKGRLDELQKENLLKILK